jgi:aspartate carbamoyltransferase catalytic subunit
MSGPLPTAHYRQATREFLARTRAPNSFIMRSLLKSSDLSASDIEGLFDSTLAFARSTHNSERHRASAVIYLIFDQPSTRTRHSFLIAASRLGMNAIEWNLATSRTASGALVLDELCSLALLGVDAFVVRSDTAIVLMNNLPIPTPIVNAGDSSEHPTQGLIDLFTIMIQMEATSLATVPPFRLAVLIPDGALIRPVNSLIGLLKHLPQAKVTMICESPYRQENDQPDLQIRRVDSEDTALLRDALRDQDYVLALPKYTNGALDRCSGYSLNSDSLRFASQARILHPLPRTSRELPEAFDRTHHNAYWDQLRLAVPTRAAVLQWSLGQC